MDKEWHETEAIKQALVPIAKYLNKEFDDAVEVDETFIRLVRTEMDRRFPYHKEELDAWYENGTPPSGHTIEDNPFDDHYLEIQLDLKGAVMVEMLRQYYPGALKEGV
jgi:hypothetical protein